MPRTKDSDFLPLQNAKAQLKFYEGELVSSMKYLLYVKTFANKGLKGYDKQLKIAMKDVADSQKNLARAKEKLKESEKLE